MLFNIDQLRTLRFHTAASYSLYNCNIYYSIATWLLSLYWLIMQILWYLSAASDHTPIYYCMTSGSRNNILQYIVVTWWYHYYCNTITEWSHNSSAPTTIPIYWKVQYIFPHPWKIGSCWIQVEVQLTGILNPKSFWKICS